MSGETQNNLNGLKAGNGGRGLKRLAAGFCVAVLFALAAATPAAAQVMPMKFNYQGNLRQNGFLVNGTRSMVFNIYTSSVAVNPVWTSDVFSVNISTGVFRVTLEPTAAVWGYNVLWLELEVEGTRMSPREEITASPYSVNAIMLSGKKYNAGPSIPPPPQNLGDLWLDSGSNELKFWDGAQWTSSSGSGLPGLHAPTHAEGGSDPIVNLGAHTVTGAITLNPAAQLVAGGGSPAVTVASNLLASSNLTVAGLLNPASNLNVGGAGYGVYFASSTFTSGFGVFLSTVQVAEGNLQIGTAPRGRVLKSMGNGFVYWGNESSIPFTGTPFRLQMADALGNELVSSLFMQNPAESNITLINGSSLTVTGNFDVGGTGLIAGVLAVGGLITASDGLEVTGGNLDVTNDLYVRGNARIGEDSSKIHGVNRVAEGGVAISVEGGAASGQYSAKFYSGSSLAAWVKKK